MSRWKWGAIAVILVGCTQTVVEVISPATVSIEGVPATLVPGATAQLTARIRGAGGEALANRTATFTSSNGAVASVTPTGFLTAVATGTASVTVTAEGVTGTMIVTVNYPVPAVTSIDPPSVLASTATTLTVRGAGFYPVSVIRVNGVARTTTFVSSAELRTTIAAADFPGAGTAQVTVSNPAPGGGISSEQQLTFRANPCSTATSLPSAGSINASLDAVNDCRVANAPVDYYSVGGLQNQVSTIRMTSTQVDPLLLLEDATGLVVASSEDVSANDRNSSLVFLGPTAMYRMSATTSASQNQSGPYTLTSSVSSVFEPVRCEPIWLVNFPTTYTIQANVATADCTVTSADGVFYSDRIYVMLKQGQSMVVTMESSAFDPYLLICNRLCQRVLEDDNSGGGTTARLTFRAETAGEHFIDARTRGVNQTGAYRLTVVINCCS